MAGAKNRVLKGLFGPRQKTVSRIRRNLLAKAAAGKIVIDKEEYLLVRLESKIALKYTLDALNVCGAKRKRIFELVDKAINNIKCRTRAGHGTIAPLFGDDIAAQVDKELGVKSGLFWGIFYNKGNRIARQLRNKEK